MAYQNDYGPQDAREAQEVRTGGPHTAADRQPKIDQWIGEVESGAEFARSLAAVLRNYRIALNGPDDRLEKVPNVQSLDTPPHPSKLVRMDESTKALHAGLHELQNEISQLQSLNLVDGPDQLF